MPRVSWVLEASGDGWWWGRRAHACLHVRAPMHESARMGSNGCMHARVRVCADAAAMVEGMERKRSACHCACAPVTGATHKHPLLHRGGRLRRGGRGTSSVR